MVDRARVIGGGDELVVVPVEAARMAVHAVEDRLAVEQAAQLRLHHAAPGPTSASARTPAACAPAMRPNVTDRSTEVPAGYSW